MNKEEELQKLMRQTYKDGYLMAVKQLKDANALEVPLTPDEIVSMLELSASTIKV